MRLDLTRQTVVRPEAELSVHVGGNPDGPTLVMVHGWPDTHRVWLPVAEALADRFRIVLYDTRGQGGSAMTERDREGASFALPVLAEDFFAVVDAVSPGAPVHVLAHDWGSIQVWEAVCEPGAEERVASFVSMSGPNLDHLATWARGRLRHPPARGVLAVAAQGMASAYVPFLASPWAGPVLRSTATAQRTLDAPSGKGRAALRPLGASDTSRGSGPRDRVVPRLSPPGPQPTDSLDASSPNV